MPNEKISSAEFKVSYAAASPPIVGALAVASKNDYKALFAKNPPPGLGEADSAKRNPIITVPETDNLYLFTQKSTHFEPRPGHPTLAELVFEQEKQKQKFALLFAIEKTFPEGNCKKTIYRRKLSEFRKTEALYFLCSKMNAPEAHFTPIEIKDVTNLVNYCCTHLEITAQKFSLALESKEALSLEFWNSAFDYAFNSQIYGTINNLTISFQREETPELKAKPKKHRLRKRKEAALSAASSENVINSNEKTSDIIQED